MNFKEFIKSPIKYCFVDFDGTIRESVEHHAPTTVDAVKVFPWAHARLLEAQKKGYKIVGITNQSYVTQLVGLEGVKQICDETVRQTGISFPYFFAKTREESKPSTFMVDEAVKQFGPADKATSIFIGDDRAKDEQCAKNFGIKFIYVDDFKDHGVP